MDTRKHWLLITSEVGARDLARAGWRSFPLGSAVAPRPASGDRIAVLRTHRPRYVASAAFIGTAEVHGDSGTALELRHRFVAPAGHEVALAEIAHLAIARGWTDERLGALMGLIVPVSAIDHTLIESKVRDVALTFGPEPSRPAHRKPRTPGRRRLIAARLLSTRPAR